MCGHGLGCRLGLHDGLGCGFGLGLQLGLRDLGPGFGLRIDLGPTGGGLALGLHGVCLTGFAGVVRHTVTVSRPRVGVNQSVPTKYPQAFPANLGQVVTAYLVEIYIPESKDGGPEYYFPKGDFCC